jgi:ADP-ribose pyrophosphatase YjhB (NUDIX family)
MLSHTIHTEYCVGFAFFGSDVILIRKARPAFQKGLLNGVGGKIEFGENVFQAMIREFFEETKTLTYINQWKYHGYLNDTHMNGVKVHVLYCQLTQEQYNFLCINNYTVNTSEAVDEPVRPVNIYEELLFLKTLNKLMYNIFDIIVELSDVLYRDVQIHRFKRYINNTKQLQERVVRCTP